jgi:hypothetical protein
VADLILVRPAVIGLSVVSLGLVAVAWWLLRRARHLWLRVLVVFAALAVALPLGLVWWVVGHQLRMKVRAGHIRSALEEYRGLHGNYPVSLSDVGVREVDGPIYYKRHFESPQVYHLWFDDGLHWIEEFDSDTGKWSFPP